MLRSLKHLHEYAIHASDGALGHVDTFLIDDRVWVVRYLVVDTGRWLPDKKVLVSPEAVASVNWKADRLNLALTRAQIEAQPLLETHAPVSLAHERSVREHTHWSAPLPPAVIYPSTIAAAIEAERNSAGAADASDPERDRLRSSEEIIGYEAHATDDVIGRLDDLIFEPQMVEDTPVWIVRYLVVGVNTSSLSAQQDQVLISPLWVTSVDYDEGQFEVDLLSGSVKNAPRYDAHAPINRVYEMHLYDYFGRPVYWQPT